MGDEQTPPPAPGSTPGEEAGRRVGLPDKDGEGFYDLTKFEVPRLKFTIKELKKGEPTGNVLKFRLDYDAIGLSFQTQIPTVFLPTGEFEEVLDPNDPDKKKKIKIPLMGMTKVYRCLKDPKEKHPENLPSMQHILKALEKAFQLPEDTGIKVRMALLNAYIEEMNRRAVLKKAMVGSPASQESTPESSTSAPSVPTPSQG
jgi:hypothetical protein